MIDEKDIRVLALLYWQAKCIIETGQVVPLVFTSDDDVTEFNEGITRLSAMEMVNHVQVTSDGGTFPNPNSKGCGVLDQYADISKRTFNEFNIMAQLFISGMQAQKAKPTARPRKKVRRRVS